MNFIETKILNFWVIVLIDICSQKHLLPTMLLLACPRNCNHKHIPGGGGGLCGQSPQGPVKSLVFRVFFSSEQHSYFKFWIVLSETTFMLRKTTFGIFNYETLVLSLSEQWTVHCVQSTLFTHHTGLIMCRPTQNVLSVSAFLVFISKY